jgi:hypothetical protein
MCCNKPGGNVPSAGFLSVVHRRHDTSMRTKPKLAIAGGLVVLTLVGAWLSNESPIEVQGRFSTEDVAELKRLGHAENRQAIQSDWSRSRGDIRQMTRVLRRFISEKVVRIARTPDDKAVVTIDRAATSGRDFGYLFVNTKTGWKLAPLEFE